LSGGGSARGGNPLDSRGRYPQSASKQTLCNQTHGSKLCLSHSSGLKVKPAALCQPNRSRSSRNLVERSLSPLDRARGESGSSFRERSLRLLEIRGLKSGRRLDKLLRVRGGCLGTKRRRRTRLPAKSVGELEANDDPAVSEWGNPPGVMSRHSRLNT
jgi:hypothetical protein